MRSDIFHLSNKQLKVIVDLPRPQPMGQDNFQQIPTSGPKGFDYSRGLTEDMKKVKIQPHINRT